MGIIKQLIMKKQEAIQAMKSGEKVTHERFSKSEFITLKNGKIHDEEDYNIDRVFWPSHSSMIWDYGWSIFNSSKS